MVFKSRHKISIGFRSGLWLGHSRTLTSLSLNHFFTTLVVCFGSLSCCYFQLTLMHLLFRAPKMSCLLFQYRHRGTCRLLKFATKYFGKKKKKKKRLPELYPNSARISTDFAQIFTLAKLAPPPPSRTPMSVGTVFFGLYASPFFLRIHHPYGQITPTSSHQTTGWLTKSWDLASDDL